MTSPYTPAPAGAAIQERRPTYDDLKRRAEEGGYGNGRPQMDSREWYALCYFTPLENFLYTELERKYYPKMDARNIAVCISTWIYAHSVDTPTYERVSDRILWLESLMRYDVNNRSVEQFQAHAMRETWERGFIFYNIDTEDNNAKVVEADQVVVTLRQDIEEFLSELVDKECAESDAAILAASTKEQLDELNEIHSKKQIEFAKESVKFLFRKDEKGEHIPLTEQEQQEWIQQIAEKYDRRITE